MMFISKFNRLIRNKAVWWGFVVLIVLSFVVWGTVATSGSGGQAADKAVAGMLDGKPVGQEEYRKSYRGVYLGMSMRFGRAMPANARMEEMLRGLAWRRLAALRQAEALGIKVADADVKATIESQPMFQGEDKRFQPERYRGFVIDQLPQMGFSGDEFIEYLRGEIALARIRFMMVQSLWIPPLDVRQVFHQLYDEFVLSYVKIDAEDVVKRVTVTDADERSYFERNKKDLAIPERRAVKAVAFTIDDYVGEERFADEDVQAFYNEHVDDYTTKDTNDFDVVKPLEEVESDIRDRLLWEQASDVAGLKASEFEEKLLPNRQGAAPVFETVATAFSKSVRTTDLFSARQPVPGLDGSLALTRAAFELRATPEDRFSRPVKGDTAYYVLGYEQALDAHLPEYDEVKETVRKAAHDYAVSNEVQRTAERLRDSFVAAVKDGKSFKDTAKTLGVKVTTTDAFSVQALTQRQEEVPEEFLALVRHFVACNPGEVTEIIPVKTGALIAFVESQKPADPMTLDETRRELTGYLKQSRQGNAFVDWQEALLVAGRFEDKMVAANRRTTVSEDETDTESDRPGTLDE